MTNIPPDRLKSPSNEGYACMHKSMLNKDVFKKKKKTKKYCIRQNYLPSKNKKQKRETSATNHAVREM